MTLEIPTDDIQRGTEVRLTTEHGDTLTGVALGDFSRGSENFDGDHPFKLICGTALAGPMVTSTASTLPEDIQIEDALIEEIEIVEG